MDTTLLQGTLQAAPVRRPAIASKKLMESVYFSVFSYFTCRVSWPPEKTRSRKTSENHKYTSFAMMRRLMSGTYHATALSRGLEHLTWSFCVCWQVHSVVSKMMIDEVLSGSWDQPTATIVMHETQPTRLQVSRPYCLQGLGSLTPLLPLSPTPKHRRCLQLQTARSPAKSLSVIRKNLCSQSHRLATSFHPYNILMPASKESNLRWRSFTFLCL